MGLCSQPFPVPCESISMKGLFWLAAGDFQRKRLACRKPCSATGKKLASFAHSHRLPSSPCQVYLPQAGRWGFQTAIQQAEGLQSSSSRGNAALSCLHSTGWGLQQTQAPSSPSKAISPNCTKITRAPFHPAATAMLAGMKDNPARGLCSVRPQRRHQRQPSPHHLASTRSISFCGIA